MSVLMIDFFFKINNKLIGLKTIVTVVKMANTIRNKIVSINQNYFTYLWMLLVFLETQTIFRDPGDNVWCSSTQPQLL